MKKYLFPALIIAVASVFALAPGELSNHGPFSPAWAQESGLVIQKVAVMPFLRGKRPEGVEEMVNCPVERLFANPDDLMDNAEDLMTRIVYRAVQSRFEDRLVPLEESAPAFEKSIAGLTDCTPRLLARKLGEALGADYIFLGNVWRFRDRNVSADGGPTGASVAFNIVFMDVKTGQKIWKETFDKTQRTLTDNLFAVKDSVKPGFRWIPANDLARMGVKEAFKRFPY